MSLPSEPITRKEQYLAKAAGQDVEIPAEPITREEAYLDAIAKGSGGGGGTSDYSQLSNKPQINGTTLTGNKSASDLSLASTADLAGKVDKVEGKVLSTNDYTDSDKAIVGGVTAALAGKQNVFTSGDYLEMANGVLNVTKNKGNDLYSYKFITTSTSDQPRVKIQRYINGVFQSEETYNNDNVRVNPVTLDGLFTFTYGVDGYRWQYTLLANSHQHNVGEVVKWMYNVSVDSTESFDVVPQDTSKNLVLQEDLDAAISSAYHHAGTKTCAELVAGLLVAGNEGNVYNMTDSGTTTADFIEGAGQPIKAGDNVGIAKISDGVYKFDLLSGFVDTTNFVQKSETAGLLKNDGTVDTTIQGDVSALKSGLTNLDNEVNGDAVTYPYADVITIEDAVPSNLADCNVKIEPVQDLHGYDKPWVGGAGKNKAPMVLADIKAANTTGTWNGNAYTLRGVTYTILTDDSGNIVGININGSTQSYSNGSVLYISSSFELTPQSYILSDNVANKPSQSYGLYLNLVKTGQSGHVAEFATYNSASTIADTTNLDYDNAELGFYMFGNKTIDNVTFYPMIRLSTETDATFAPYTNICPITGHTEASVQRDGKNLVESTIPNTRPNAQGNLIDADGFYTAIAAISKGIQYVVSTDQTNLAAGFFDEMPSISTIAVSNIDTPNKVFTAPIDGYIAFRCASSYTTPQVEYGSTSTPYEPYAGKTYTIALGDTIYGGTVDFDSGVLSSYGDIASKDDFGWGGGSPSAGGLYYVDYNVSAVANVGMSNMLPKEDSAWDKTYPCVNINTSRIRIYGNFTSIAEFKEQYSGLQVYYQKATPFTVQLTPTQIQLLKGHNTLTASTGQISVTVNGVSGAIGQVQEQVNEIDGEIGDINSVLSLKTATAGTNITIVKGGYLQIGKLVIVDAIVTADDDIGVNQNILKNLPSIGDNNYPISCFDIGYPWSTVNVRVYYGGVVGTDQLTSGHSYHIYGSYMCN